MGFTITAHRALAFDNPLCGFGDAKRDRQLRPDPTTLNHGLKTD